MSKGLHLYEGLISERKLEDDSSWIRNYCTRCLVEKNGWWLLRAETLSEDEDEMSSKLSKHRRGSGGYTPAPGGPFSALIPSMWPQDILAKLAQTEDAGAVGDFRYDEFGFRVEVEDAAEPNSSKLLSEPFIEDPQQRLKWTAYFEFAHNTEVGDLTWESMESRLPQTEKLRSLVREGIPHSMRHQLWMRLCGAQEKKSSSEMTYREIIKASSSDQSMAAKQIEKDLLRTMPSNACFSNQKSTGVPRLRRVLRGISWLYPDIGYCQGTGVIVASLLLFMDEEDAFWIMCSVVEDLVPPSYFSHTLLGVQADQRVLRQLMVSYLPELDQLLKSHDIELSLITLHWFLTAFASVVHMKVLLRIWDMFFFDGSIVLFQITLAMFKMKEEELLSLDNSAQIFNALSDLPGVVDDMDKLVQKYEIGMRHSASLTDIIVDTHRRKHLAYLMAEQGAIVNPESAGNLPKQQVNKRQLQRRKSLMGALFPNQDDSNDLKAKNIRQTELVSDLREAIQQIGRHFQAIDPKNAKIGLIPDYSLESHQKDHEQFVNITRTRKRRAKALLDFERHDDDELGFRKNDIITIISQKDEHCWVGELNGLRGWFPAKFVEILDERSKQYTSAGDDAVTETITDLVRGSLCPALKAVFEHGLKQPSILGATYHPWHFIEEASAKEVERDFESVYSRLVLCKTYRLDEDGKVLTPEELLYRSVQAVNLTHDVAHAQMDVKFRSLTCLGLNEQVLHLWLETLCSCDKIVEKWYHPWSFLRSPGWVQIKCELRVLSNFAFNLSQDWELPIKKDTWGRAVNPPQTLPSLKASIRDMLIKYHLFSWEL
ncbi:small G protein signaling modulator 3 homolog isoform X4 [Lytechinus variegatus]|uniref:small G protein signaling modulator 3 homolog isoform X4 n=1 Tax=Lytechinus variegatus TaxID=7654 RepID=UPI001BB286B3|nr:small G protein signaling modulator 3 homolog isoform X4 [Lytechinus variegatus]